MKLSIIIPAYNAASTIGFQLEALARQEWSDPWEVIVVNNRSMDRTVEVAKKFVGQIPNLQIVDALERQGGPYTLNVGVRLTQGEWLAFCDADDVVCEGWVAAMGDALAKNEFVSGPFETQRLNSSDLQKHRINPQPEGIQEYTYPPYLPHAAGASLGVHRSVFEEVGGFDESMLCLQDTDFCWRVQLAGHKLNVAPEAIIHYRFRDSVSGIFKQAFNYAIYNVLLYKRYRTQGMPRLTLLRGVRNLIDFMQDTRVFNKDTRALWLWDAGWLAGRLYASIRYRVVAL